MTALVIIWFGLAIIAVPIAHSKNRKPLLWFFGCLISGGIGLVLLYVLPRLTPIEGNSEPAIAVRKCPSCAEMIRAEATRCRYCKIELDGRAEA